MTAVVWGRIHNIFLAATIAVGLTACRAGDPPASDSKSLTGSGFSGKKFYLGWGHADPRDPDMMHNQAKYDVIHTHDIFTKELGGSYQGTTSTGNDHQSILKNFNSIRSQIGPQDMFVQYSAGHGFQKGLQYGGSYEEIATRILALPAKEIIVFIMACHSGGLVDAFNRRRAQWQNWTQSGRTLYVLASSTIEQTSASGPTSDPSQPGYPLGSAGSAFGHALWKALSGEADGFIDGVKDGMIDLGEIDQYTKAKTKRVGGHDPVSTGTFNANLIMNVVPSQADLSFPNRGTRGLTETAIRDLVRKEDQLWHDRPPRAP